MPKRIARQIYNKLVAAPHVILVPHQHPDADAIGAVTALADFLASQNIDFSIYCSTDVSKNLHFLKYTDRIAQDDSVWSIKDAVALVVDSGDPEYAGIGAFYNQKGRPYIMVIDHHASNTHFGDLNLVLTTASSTTEILHDFFAYNNVAVTPTMATSLMAGLIYDTGNFSNAGTSKRALKVGSNLIHKRADMGSIKDNLLKNKSVQALKLWGLVLSRLAIHPEHNIAYTFLTQQDMDSHTVSEEEVEGLANLLNHLNDGHAAMVLKEKKEGGTKASLRTTKDSVNVSTIAQHFGGGGHKKAAGFSLEHSIEEAIEHIFDSLTEHQLVFVEA